MTSLGDSFFVAGSAQFVTAQENQHAAVITTRTPAVIVYDTEKRGVEKEWRVPSKWGLPVLGAVFNEASGRYSLATDQNKVFSWSEETSVLDGSTSAEKALPSRAFAVVGQSLVSNTFILCDDKTLILTNEEGNESVIEHKIETDNKLVAAYVRSLPSSKKTDRRLQALILSVAVERGDKTSPVVSSSLFVHLVDFRCKGAFAASAAARGGGKWLVEDTSDVLLVKKASLVRSAVYHASENAISVVFEEKGEWNLFRLNSNTATPSFTLIHSLPLATPNHNKWRGSCCAIGESFLLSIAPPTSSASPSPAAKKSNNGKQSGAAAGPLIESVDVVFGVRHVSSPLPALPSSSAELASSVAAASPSAVVSCGNCVVAILDQHAVAVSVVTHVVTLNNSINKFSLAKGDDIPEMIHSSPINGNAFIRSLIAGPGGAKSSSKARESDAVLLPEATVRNKFEAVSSPRQQADQALLVVLQSKSQQVSVVDEEVRKYISSRSGAAAAAGAGGNASSGGAAAAAAAKGNAYNINDSTASWHVVQHVLRYCIESENKETQGIILRLLNANLVILRSCPNLVPLLIQWQSLSCLYRCVSAGCDPTERDLVAVLRFFLSDVSPTVLDAYATSLNNAPGIKKQEGQKGFQGGLGMKKTQNYDRDGVRRLFLDLVLCSTYNEPFLTAQLKKMSLIERALKYCRSLLQRLGSAPHARQSHHRMPTLSNVLDWANCIVDAHVESLILTDEGRELVSSLRKTVDAETALCIQLEPLQGLLFHLIHKKEMPVPPVPDYRIEHLEL